MWTILLLCAWTLWLAIALPMLVAAPRRIPVAVLFVVLSIVMWAWTAVAWRSYLMAFLIGHAAISGYAGWAATSRRRRIDLVRAAVSSVGLLWLWLDGGAAHWRFVVAVVLVIGLGGAAGWLIRYAVRSTAPDVAATHRPAPPPAEAEQVVPKPVPLPRSPANPRPPADPTGETPAAQPAPRPRYPAPPVPPRVVYPELDGAGIVPGDAAANSVSFPIQPDGAATPTGQTIRLTPRLFPAVVVTAETDAAPDRTAPVFGLARYFPAGTVHGTRSIASAKDRCPHSDVVHYHVHRVSTRSPDEPEAFAVRETTMVAHIPAEATDPRRVTAYVIEETVVSVAGLRARDAALRDSFHAALAELIPAGKTAAFLCDLLRAAHRDGELALLPEPPNNAVFGLFGSAVVRPDRAVLLRPLPGAGHPYLR